MHTELCGHAVGNPIDYIPIAAERGIQLLTFTCHTPMSNPAFGGPRIRMGVEQIETYRSLVNDAAELGEQFGIEVLCGIEAEIFPDAEEMASMDAFIETQSFDFVLGSLHHQLPIYRQYIMNLDLMEDEEIIDRYFQDLAEGARSGRYHSIAHPDVIRIYGTVQQMEPAEHEPAFREFLQAAVDNDVCIEVNTSGLIKGVYQVHPDPLYLKWAYEMGAKLTIGSDSHHPESVGQKFEEVLPMLTSIGFKHLHYHRQGERIAIEIE